MSKQEMWIERLKKAVPYENIKGEPVEAIPRGYETSDGGLVMVFRIPEMGFGVTMLSPEREDGKRTKLEFGISKDAAKGLTQLFRELPE